MDTVRILRSDGEAKLVFDDMRREMLRLLAKEALTAHRLSTILGLSSPTVGHHIDALKKSELVEMVGMEAEAHGIVQKFYRASAQAFIIEPRRLSPSVRRYFMPARIERTRGMVAALSLNLEDEYRSTSRSIETATEKLGEHILESAEARQGQAVEKDPETVINRIYREALQNLIRSKPDIFPPVRQLEVETVRRPIDDHEKEFLKD